ncbi:ABC transporter ATP-binding protein [Staphylococcus kloosii]|uniref:ABC transporter ATP-binding protein n=1 Tax=Staphylococcus kloosii TaxID=29384 RepID=UPI001E618352|nr:ABC transporter ATP-binding protein [Staphylococcus kloosii]MCD8878065.1 ABC transporter ATP-binding protein [Staphylococcus kloosii]
MIKLVNISKSYKSKKVINAFNYDIEDGDFIVISGESGKGKTTLLNIIGLLEKPDSGKISYNNRVLSKQKDILHVVREDIAYIYQNYGLLVNETVFTNLTLPLNISKKDKDKINSVLINVGLDENILKEKVYSCSGGEQQRIAIARAILKQPKVLIADEPTGNLDENNSDEVMKLFTQLNSQGVSIVMATHNKKYFDLGNKIINLDTLIK